MMKNKQNMDIAGHTNIMFMFKDKTENVSPETVATF